ncbi:hypothetical protein CROQUDRAFT_49369 [Cronartium quercuum f. sp. fusiforme G11]|uniref:ML-like domain-containing protein n=1 Tax=Cronartium quercuum f. sp. fusiforme G11 TaxID=708437 RepID=A0A9P6NAM5_9BASI|nr:hypothetical protein CROQUDRAFT_49369 [Cronartium quercuum f. sp. fusiforme G11]
MTFISSTLFGACRNYSLFILFTALRITSRSNVIETSSVSYCSPPVAIVIDTFDVRYYTSNNSLNFDLSAASVTQGLNLEAQLSLNAYGIHALNLSIDFCSVLSGVLCPLPTYNFTGSGGYTIPSAQVPSIPGVAWVVPDLEAVITVLLTDTRSNVSAACLQVQLTNGLTVGHTAVSWATAAVLISSFSLAIIQPHQFGILFLILADQLQHMAMTGMISLNYPSVFRTWSTNFAYAVGLISSEPISRAVDRLREHTGGNGFTTAQDIVAFTSRLFSPYNQVNDPSVLQTTSVSSASAARARAVVNKSSATTTFNKRQFASGSVNAGVKDANYAVPVVTQNTTLLDPGLAAYVNELGFPVENAFTVVFLWAIILLAIMICLTLLLGLFFWFIRRNQSWRKDTISRSTDPALKALMFIWPPITLFTCWQWRLGNSDAWSPILLSVIAWLSTTAGLGYAAWVVTKRREIWVLKDRRWWAFVPLGIICFVKLAVIGFGQGHGERQVVATIILETLRTLFLIIGRPFRQTRWNVAASLISILQLIQFCILETFVPRQGVKPIPRAVLGLVSILIQSLGFILLFGYAFVLLLLLGIRYVFLLIPITFLVLLIFFLTNQNRTSKGN